MANKMRIESLKSVAEAAGFAMAPSADQFDAEPDLTAVDETVAEAGQGMDAGNYSRSWARPRYRSGFEERMTSRHRLLTHWFQARWHRALST
jgi:hypothetical protein